MGNILRSPLIKIICCYLALFMAGLIPVPKTARASFISHHSQEISEPDPRSSEALQAFFENELIAEKLSELGLSSDEIIQKVGQLGSEERKLVIEKLETIQSGGMVPVLAQIIITILFLPVWLLVKIIEGIAKSGGDKGEAEEAPGPEGIDETTNFWKTQGIDLPPYGGEVRILDDPIPEETSVQVGRVYLKGNGTKYELLEKMKAEAARYGADTIVLMTEEPEKSESQGFLLWSARAYRTKDLASEKHFREGITFYGTYEYFPPYEGEVRALFDVEPEKESVLIGTVYIKEKGTKDELLGKLKAEAAKYGADTIILSTDEPEPSESSDFLFWSARAFRSQKEDVENKQ